MPLVQITGISKHYPSGKTVIRAVSNVSLSIERGEFIAIRGGSGSGKSALMNLLGLLERPNCGEYSLDGREVVKLNEDIRASIRSQDIGFIFQIPALLPRASALENVAGQLVLNYSSRNVRLWHKTDIPTGRNQRLLSGVKRTSMACSAIRIWSQTGYFQRDDFATMPCLV